MNVGWDHLLKVGPCVFHNNRMRAEKELVNYIEFGGAVNRSFPISHRGHFVLKLPQGVCTDPAG